MDALTFDLTSMFTGEDFPTDTFPVFVNERIAFELSRLEEKILQDPENEALEAERVRLLDEARGAMFEVTLQGVPRDQYLAVVEDIAERFPSELTGLGRLKPNRDRDEALESAVWSLYIKSIRDPHGAVGEGITEEEATLMRRNLPGPAVSDIATRISNLSQSVQKGYEGLAQEIDFLSQR